MIGLLATVEATISTYHIFLDEPHRLEWSSPPASPDLWVGCPGAAGKLDSYIYVFLCESVARLLLDHVILSQLSRRDPRCLDHTPHLI